MNLAVQAQRITAEAIRPEEIRKIVLADDAELFLDLEASILSQDGLQIFTAQDGQQALDLVRRERPDLVFLDLYMPRLDGDACCRQLKDDPDLRSIPVVMVTGSQRDECLQRCREADCDDIIFKPINRQKMMEVADRFLAPPCRGERIPARLSIRYGTGGADLLTDYSVNLSTGGLYLETEAPLPAETALEIAFALPGKGQIIRCRGRVAWVNAGRGCTAPRLPPGMGVQFLGLGLSEMNAIREYILNREILPYW